MAPSRLVRIQWWPPLAIACFVYFVFRCMTSGVSPFRLAGLALTALWASIALYDWKSGGKVMRWMYPDDPDDGMN
ncbi:MAG: hypothetical protein IPQ07_25495 [Myxococcales bacterium]|nr:hypothetical protein [Myxococcales bacterium]